MPRKMGVDTNNWLAHVKPLLRLGGPLIVNYLAVAGMHFADAVMAGRLGADALAAVAVGASVWFLGFSFSLGLLMAISPIVARHFGAGRFFYALCLGCLSAVHAD